VYTSAAAGVKVGWRQFREGKCPCVKKKKTAECVCLKCTYLISNVARLHVARRAWHRAARQRVGGKPCVCHIHPPAGAAEAAAERAAACQGWEEAERAAMEEGGDGASERWAAAVAERQVAEAEAAAAAAKAAKARKYDEMFSSVEALTETLMPCGKESHPELSIIGAGQFRTYKRRCISNDCTNRIFHAGEACGFERVFGSPCPTELGGEAAEWRRWEKRLRGVNEEGKEFHSLEWVPAHGTRTGLWAELLPAVTSTLPHMWRDNLMQQSVRVYEDRKSGRHLHELVKRRRLLTMPQLLFDALDVVVQCAELQLEPPVLAQPSPISRQVASLRALKRLAADAEKPTAAEIEPAQQSLSYVPASSLQPQSVPDVWPGRMTPTPAITVSLWIVTGEGAGGNGAGGLRRPCEDGHSPVGLCFSAGDLPRVPCNVRNQGAAQLPCDAHWLSVSPGATRPPAQEAASPPLRRSGAD